jgi:hypothetical protein
MAYSKITRVFRLRDSNRVIPLSAVTREWPNSVPLDFDVVRSGLWHHAGNVTMAAVYLRVDIARLRRFVTSNEEEFAEDLAEIKERLVEHAKRVAAIKR